jgi:ribosomal protein L7/L12
MEPIKKILPYDLTDRKIVELLRQKKYLDAVKFCKKEKNIGLKEAKDHVDKLAAQYGIERPKGCSQKAAVLVVVLVIIFYAVA